MKLLLTFLLSLSITTGSFGQTITYEDFRAVIPFLQKEDFKGAFEKTSQLLSGTENDSLKLRGIVIYMNIFSSAGMVAQDQMSHEDFTKNANQYIGQHIVMSAHPCIDSSVKSAFNSLQFVKSDSGQLKGMTITANSSQTNILCFEYFNYTDDIVPAELIGKNVRCGGILKSIETNPRKSKIWICRLRISDAFAHIMIPNDK